MKVGKKYIDDGIAVPATRLVNKKLEYVIGVNNLYMDWLKYELQHNPLPGYNNDITSPYATPISRLKPFSQLPDVDSVYTFSDFGWFGGTVLF